MTYHQFTDETGDPSGPFETEQDAIIDANEY